MYKKSCKVGVISELVDLIEFGNKLLSNFLKILIATMFMSLFLYFGLDYFEDKFEYSYKFKLIYLLIIVFLSAAIYLFLARFLGVLNLKSYKLKWAKISRN